MLTHLANTIHTSVSKTAIVFAVRCASAILVGLDLVCIELLVIRFTFIATIVYQTRFKRDEKTPFYDFVWFSNVLRKFIIIIIISDPLRKIVKILAIRPSIVHLLFIFLDIIRIFNVL